MTTRSPLPGWAVAVALGVLLAAPAARADRNQCELNCGSQHSSSLQSCMQKCPDPGNPGSTKSDSHRACAVRCTQKFQTDFKACTDRCPKPDAQKASKKAGTARGARLNRKE